MHTHTHAHAHMLIHLLEHSLTHTSHYLNIFQSKYHSDFVNKISPGDLNARPLKRHSKLDYAAAKLTAAEVT